MDEEQLLEMTEEELETWLLTNTEGFLRYYSEVHAWLGVTIREEYNTEREEWAIYYIDTRPGERLNLIGQEPIGRGNPKIIALRNAVRHLSRVDWDARLERDRSLRI